MYYYGTNLEVQPKHFLPLPFLISIAGGVGFVIFGSKFGDGTVETIIAYGGETSPVHDAFRTFLVLLSVVLPVLYFFINPKYYVLVFPLNVLSVYWYYAESINMLGGYIWCKEACGIFGYFMDMSPIIFRNLFAASVFLFASSTICLVYASRMLQRPLFNSNLTVLPPKHVIPSIIFLALTAIFYIVHRLKKDTLMADNYDAFFVSKDSIPFFLMGVLLIFAILCKVYNFLPYIYSFLLVTMLMTLQNIIAFVELHQEFMNSPEAINAIFVIIVMHICLGVLECFFLVWIIGRNLFSVPCCNNRAEYSLRVTVPAAVYLAVTIAGTGLYIKYTPDYSPLGGYIFGILSLALFIIAKSESGEFYVSIIPGLIMCIGSISPVLDRNVYEITSGSYTTLNLPIVLGVAVVLLSQFAALFHDAALAIVATSHASAHGDKYHYLRSETPQEDIEEQPIMAAEHDNVGINE